jgi:RNA polymerase sigma factor (sigma-70 family)
MSDPKSPHFSCCHAPPMDCPSLVNDRLSGDPDAAERMQARFGPLVKGIVRKKLGSEHQDACEDVCQEAWIRIDAGLDQWNGRNRFCAYLATITAHTAIDYLRSAARKPSFSHGYEHDVADENPEPGERLVRKEEVAGLLNWIQQYRQQLPIAELHAWELLEKGLSKREVASELGVRVRTIEWYINKTATRIARRLRITENGIKVVRKLIPDIVGILTQCMVDD